MKRPQQHNHLIRNVPNNVATRGLVRLTRYAMRKSESRHTLLMRGRGPKHEKAARDGVRLNRDSTPLKYARRFAIYLRPTAQERRDNQRRQREYWRDQKELADARVRRILEKQEQGQ
jgi:hypothetical protein